MQTDGSTRAYILRGALPNGSDVILDSETRYLYLRDHDRSLQAVSLLPLQALLLELLLEMYPEPCHHADIYKRLQRQTGNKHDYLLPALLKECHTLLQTFGLGISQYSSWFWLCKLEDELS